MSGSGLIPSARSLPADEVAAERAATVSFLEAKIAEVNALVARQRVPAMDGAMLNRRLKAVAEAIGQGFHR